MGKNSRTKLVPMTRKPLLTNAMMLSLGSIPISWLNRRNSNTNRKNWKVFATPSSLSCTRQQVVPQVVECQVLEVCQTSLVQVVPQVLLPAQDPEVGQPLRRLIKEPCMTAQHL